MVSGGERAVEGDQIGVEGLRQPKIARVIGREARLFGEDQGVPVIHREDVDRHLAEKAEPRQ